jgi:carbamate kinase
VKNIMEKNKIVVVALGGNAISQQFEEGNIHQQFANTRKSLLGVVELIKRGFRVVITHGNGPQVGNALIRVEESRHLVPMMPLGVIVADTEGGMGYMVEQCLQNKMHDKGIKKEVATLATQVLVDPDDPSIKNPTKFVGPFYKKEQVKQLLATRHWIMKEDPGRGWRRVVPSPIPLEIVEKKILRILVENDVIVVAVGGGGIPVYIDPKNGWLEGIDAVIDKDLASAVLAKDIGAQHLMILTAVEKVALNFKKKNQVFLNRMSLAEAKKFLKEGHFPPGSMGPKIQAAINFIEGGGEEVIISSIANSVSAVEGKNGTKILPN